MKKLLTITLLSIISATSFASTDSPYTMAVIKNTNGANEIKQGLYEQGIKQINKTLSSQTEIDMVATQMNLCVAYASTEDFNNANSACDRAIELSSNYQKSSTQAKRVAALALNNRAILKAKLKDYDGAVEDLILALDVKKSRTIKNNLLKIQELQTQNVQSAQTQSSEV